MSTCPIGGNCKHAGALALAVSERLKNGGEIPTNVPKMMLENFAPARDRSRLAFLNEGDVNVDCVTGFVSKSRMLYFGKKGNRFAEEGCLGLYPQPSPWRSRDRGAAFVRRDQAAFFALADYLLRPMRKVRVREFSLGEWQAFLKRVRLLMTDERFKTWGYSSILSEAFVNSANQQLLEDVERWSEKALGSNGRMRMALETR